MSAANNNIAVRNNPSNPANVQIFNVTTSTVLQEVAISSITNIVITGANTTDTLTVTYPTAINPAPKGAKQAERFGPPMVGVDPKKLAEGFGAVRLTSAALKLEVVEK